MLESTLDYKRILNSRFALEHTGTVRYLQHLLDRKFFPGYPDTSANWICSLSCVSSPHNGTLFCDFLGLADDNRSVRMGSLLHVAIACVSLAHWFGLLKILGIDFRIEHFGFRKMSFGKLLRAVFFAEHPLIKNGDWCCPDLSVKGAMKLNKMGSFKSTYYFSYVTRQTERRLVTAHHWPTPQMHFAVMWISACVGAWEPQGPPPYPNFKASEWWENDGVVSVCSQDYPRFPKPHRHAPIRLPEDEEEEQQMDGAKSSESFVPLKGVWYFSSPVRMDHMTVSMAPRNQKQEHRTLYLHVRYVRARSARTSLLFFTYS